MRFAVVLLLAATSAPAQEQEAPPALPSPNEDFSTDQAQFGEVVTEPEKQREAERRARESLVKDAIPLYTRMPALDYVTEAAAGVFAAGALGVLGGAIGEAIDPGEPSQPLGGFHGPVFGALPGSAVGATMGVWGAAQLYGKETDIGWTVLGSSIGTLVGGGAAFGISAGLGEGDTTTTLALTTYLLAQVGLAIVFTDVYAPPVQAANAPR